jgi:hypothetical protein
MEDLIKLVAKQMKETEEDRKRQAAQWIQEMKRRDAEAEKRENALREIIAGMQQAQLEGDPVGKFQLSTDFQDVSGQVEKFIYQPEEGLTFDRWINRAQRVFASDKGKKLSDSDKAAIICAKLSAEDYNQFESDQLPKKLEALTLEETTKHLMRLFGKKESVFSRRYRGWQTEIGADESYLAFAARIKKTAEDFEMESFGRDDLMTQLFVQGLKSAKHAMVRKKMLEKADEYQAKLESAEEASTVPKLTVDQLADTATRLANLDKVNKTVDPIRAIEVTAIQKNVRDDKKLWKCRLCTGFHFHRECPYKDKRCYDCNEVGHQKGSCQSAKDFKDKMKKKRGDVKVDKVETKKSARKFVRPRINGVQVTLKLDTGSDWTIISSKNWTKVGQPRLSPATVTAVSASGDTVSNLGYFSAVCDLNGVTSVTDVYVSKEGLNLFGNGAMEALDLWNTPISAVCSSISESHKTITEKVRSKFPKLFSLALGKCNKTTFAVNLIKDAKVPFMRARPVPIGARKPIEEELKRLEHQEIITQINYATAAAPIVAVKKKNGTIRIAADYSTGLNRALEFYHYPLPTPETIFASLAGMDTFSTLDLSSAFLQVELSKEAKRIMNINTHMGLFQVNRMQPGVKTAPGQFQQLMDTILAGTKAMPYLDDIIVGGKGEKDHQDRLYEVLKRLEDAGLTLGIDKCTFGQKEIKFLGKIIDQKGQRPDPEKLKVIRNLPQPKDLSQLRAFLGAVNWYGTFLPQLKDLRGPLDEMLRKGEKFVWTAEREEAFNKLKQALHSNLGLAHYDPTLPLIVAADASSYGIGATLLHRLQDGTMRPIMHAASSFNDAERNYPQVEREALALVYAVKKFHQYIYGRKFELHTDHKPLLTIFGSKSGIPVHTANRLRRYALTLLGYDFVIKYIDGDKFAYADFVSRLIETHPKPGSEDIVIAAIREMSEEADDEMYDEDSEIAVINTLPVSKEELRKATQECDHLQKVIKYVQSSWPQKKKQVEDVEAAEYFTARLELRVIGECLFHGDRPVIPPTLRKRMLEELHEGHPGASRMQALARVQCFWPGIYKQINSYVQRCENCAINAKCPKKEILHPWPKPSGPWQRVHIDFAGPMEGDFFFVMVDAFSNWPEIVKMRSTTTEKTIQVMEEIFARWGPCSAIVSDNGPQFIASAFKDFCKKHAINHITSAPYHPQSNGRAERFVDIMKTGMRKLEGEGNVDERLRQFLTNYRRTPSNALDGKSPFELMTGRKMPTRHDHLLATATAKDKRGDAQDARMELQFNRHHGAVHRNFNPGEPIYYQLHQNNGWSWQAGTVIKKMGLANFEVKVGERVVKAHANQLKKRFVKDEIEYDVDDFSSPINDFYASQDNMTGGNVEVEMRQENLESETEDEYQSFASEDQDETEPEINSEIEDPLPEPSPPRPTRPQRTTRMPAKFKDFVTSIVEFSYSMGRDSRRSE